MYEIGNIVRGINAGTFVVVGHVQVLGQQWNRLTEVDERNHSHRMPGTIALPDENLTFVQDKQCHYISWTPGCIEGKFIAMAEHLADCNPGHPIEVYGTSISVIYCAKGDYIWMGRQCDGTLREIGYGAWWAAFREFIHNEQKKALEVARG